MTLDNFNHVGAFQKKFGLPVLTYREGPRWLDPEVQEFRTKFLEEELQEYKDAVEAQDHAKAFDALIDLVYVAMGNAHWHNYPWQPGWEAVQRANMRKVRAQRPEDSERGGTFDVIKPPGWTPPDIQAVLDLYNPSGTVDEGDMEF